MISLSHTLTVFRRELAAYFNAAIAYIFIIVFVLLNGGLYMTQFFVIGFAEMRPFFNTLPFMLAVFVPAITMRLWAEEKRGNTLELLLTFPMATHELVIGKFLASFVFYLAALAGTLPLPIMLRVLGHPDLGMILGGYIGSALLGAFLLSIGIFISGLCRDQIVAFILAMLICFGLHLMGTEFIASSIDSWLPGFGSFLREHIGSAGHFDSFARGVLDNRDLLYYVVGTVIFLVLNGFWFEGRMRPGAKKIFSTAVVISVGIFLLGNWLLSSLPIGRFDLTEGRIYTVSPATKKILRELKAPVTIKYYVSPVDKMPTGMKTLEQSVIDKLDELKVSSGGNLQYKVFHMEAANVVEQAPQGKDDSLEQQLQRKGIEPFQVRAIESDEVAVRLVYSSISIAYKEKAEELIPRVMPENIYDLEYLLISKVYRLTLIESPRIALMAPYEEKQVEPELQQLLTQLGGGQIPEGYREDNYELLEMALNYEGYQFDRIKLNREQPIPEGTKTLIIIEPKELSERQQYEVNRFLRQGGSLFLAVQNYEYQYTPASDNQLQIIPQSRNPNINPVLSAWGFDVDEKILVDEQHDVINLSGAARLGPFEVSVPVKIPTQILISQSGMNQDVSITSRLSPLFYLWGTAIKINDEKIKAQNLDVKTLLKSSSASWTVNFQPQQLTPNDLMRLPDSAVGPFPLAIMAQGTFNDAFEGKGIPEWPKDDIASSDQSLASPVPGPMTPAPGKLILMGSSTMFQKHLLRSGGHLNLFLNAVDALTLGDELVTIRSKRPIDRSLGRISAGEKIAWRLFVTLFIPVLIAVIGTMRVLLRRQSKQVYLKSLSLVTA